MACIVLPVPLATHFDAVIRAVQHATPATAPTIVQTVISEFACLTDLVEMTYELSAAINNVVRNVEFLAEALLLPNSEFHALRALHSVGSAIVVLRDQLARAEPSEEARAQDLSW
ncbi:hypothetical protein CCR97_20980 [Rhodoplanes elegans]|uniref:Uncharacterized protein n=1 Tax=Rhodoplanes elegans TaxID=29408 RepID=A0A327KKT1_9BRAD|nr:hypothetical protein [Rhodoplanes elegans]MBK5960656.1 hypothetical protein [Rhodoplanes elegans]RAI39097.1 hypothetical protein CH338_10475 [Rhodoplanes elegans]